MKKTSCSTGGCSSKTNGSCTSERFTVFDWFSKQNKNQNTSPFVEIAFKNGRKDFFETSEIKDISLKKGDAVVVEVDDKKGFDIGYVSISSRLTENQMRRKKVLPEHCNKKALRLANQSEIDNWIKLIEKEKETLSKVRDIIKKYHDIQMKISDIEHQADGKKIICYYTSDKRVDFRVLVKDLAVQLSSRIEMRQISPKAETSRIGAIGTCGRELCCSSWITDFRKVNASAARYQQLSINSEKITGHCGKLKCCLNFELDAYTEELKKFPDTKTFLKTKGGSAKFQKMDIFSNMLWYSYKGDINWYKLKTEQVHNIINDNKKGKEVPHLSELTE